MVTKSEVLYARFQKRAAELSGEPTEPRKKAKTSAKTSTTTTVEARASRPVRPEAGRGEGVGSGGATMAPPCPVPISQVPGRREAPDSDQGGRTSADLALARPTSTTQRSGQPSTRPQFPSSEPGNSQEATGSAAPRPAEAGLAGPSGPQERVPYAPGWAVFEGDSALDNVQVAREVLRVALLPADQAKIRSMNYGEFMDSAICSSIRRLHETETMIHIIQDYRDRARRHQRGREEAETKFLASEAEQKVLQAKLGAAEDEVRTLVAELEEEKGAHSLTRSEVRAAEARRTEAESSLAIREQEVGEARIKLRHLLPDFDVNLLKPGAGRAEAEAESPGAEAAVADPEATEVAPEAAPIIAEAIVEVSAAEPTTPGTAEAEVVELEPLV
ncbi:putative sodium-coupled neutral amino acid transporter 10 [Phoenix dactylifera]|uniref:Sodium-coupled neutral amino acid transporter 10 n=1 Tax=Phoenix dactylifera TaxID=42345 RepID=A0A8B9ASZ3_PHODC|nr:putative sodium-coupled neutral amino acid transporter 10 [Phoenix dactylifera]